MRDSQRKCNDAIDLLPGFVRLTRLEIYYAFKCTAKTRRELFVQSLPNMPSISQFDLSISIDISYTAAGLYLVHTWCITRGRKVTKVNFKIEVSGARAAKNVSLNLHPMTYDYLPTRFCHK